MRAMPKNWTYIAYFLNGTKVPLRVQNIKFQFIRLEIRYEILKMEGYRCKGGYPKNWTYIEYFLRGVKLSSEILKFEITADLVENWDKNPQNSDNQEVPPRGGCS